MWDQHSYNVTTTLYGLILAQFPVNRIYLHILLKSFEKDRPIGAMYVRWPIYICTRHTIKWYDANERWPIFIIGHLLEYFDDLFFFSSLKNFVCFANRKFQICFALVKFHSLVRSFRVMKTMWFIAKVFPFSSHAKSRKNISNIVNFVWNFIQKIVLADIYLFIDW